MAGLLLDFFTTDSTAREWYLAATPGASPACGHFALFGEESDAAQI